MPEGASSPADDRQREEVGSYLKSGAETEVYPRAETSEMVNETVARLQDVPVGDLSEKLKIAGFTDYPIEVDEIEQSCETCMYYLIHRKFCELPELMVAVEPEWSCRLWRI